MKASKKLAAAALMFAATLNMNGCGVYGPPPEDDISFDPEVNIEQNVYGPPPDNTPYIAQFETGETDETAESTESCETVEIAEFKPEQNIAVTVYGPPSAFV